MSAANAAIVATLFVGLFLVGLSFFAAGVATSKEARRGYLGADWHQYQRQRARAWLTLAGLCWLGDVWLWLVVR